MRSEKLSDLCRSQDDRAGDIMAALAAADKQYGSDPNGKLLARAMLASSSIAALSMTSEEKGPALMQKVIGSNPVIMADLESVAEILHEAAAVLDDILAITRKPN